MISLHPFFFSPAPKLIKRCLQYAQQGVWLGLNKPRPILPTPITLLYQQWESSQNRSWLIFRKYLNTFSNVTVHQPDSDHDYVFKASLNGSHKKMKEYSARQLKKKILCEPQITRPHVLRVLPALLDEEPPLWH
jgi:hypothetical protein